MGEWFYGILLKTLQIVIEIFEGGRIGPIFASYMYCFMKRSELA